jgi:DNA/RNA-binding domain of Phe-tRNA-synthetase-like protein
VTEVAASPHPLLEAAAFEAELPRPLGELASPGELVGLLSLSAPAPLGSSDAIRAAVRDLLRHGGFKPTGRSKPASEYLIRAATDGQLGSINLVVDACNVASLHSGLPISVVDLDRTRAPLSIRVAEGGAAYVFNAAGQTIDVGGLLCLCDADGPCANAVKDAQRTKTRAGTRRILAVIWGTNALPGRANEVAGWYRELLAPSGAATRAVTLVAG